MKRRLKNEKEQFVFLYNFFTFRLSRLYHAYLISYSAFRQFRPFATFFFF